LSFILGILASYIIRKVLCVSVDVITHLGKVLVLNVGIKLGIADVGMAQVILDDPKNDGEQLEQVLYLTFSNGGIKKPALCLSSGVF
jgi:hypothetical protein